MAVGELSEGAVNAIMLEIAATLERDLNGPAGALDFGFLLLIRRAGPAAGGVTRIGGISNMAPEDVSDVLAEYEIARVKPDEWRPIAEAAMPAAPAP
jgi:hypothetical protein